MKPYDWSYVEPDPEPLPDRSPMALLYVALAVVVGLVLFVWWVR